MFMTSNDVEFLVFGVISVSDPFDKVCNHSRVIMSNKEVINMPAHRKLFAIYHFVGNTWIIRVDCKVEREKVSHQFTIE